MMKKFENEVKERFGETGAYKEYAEKTAAYTEEKWQEATDGLNAIFVKFAECKKSGQSADSEGALTLVGKLQAHITENYYTCGKEILAALGQMYVSDPRFKQNIDKNGSGTAEFVSRAIKIYCQPK